MIMKTFIAFCVGVFALSSFSFADETSSEYDTSLLLNTQERIPVDGGSSGWYFTPHFGYNLISNTATEGFNIKFDDGISFGVGFGVEVKTDIAFEIDLSYIRNDVDTITDGSGAGSEPDIEYTQIPLMFNLIWSPSHQPDVQPFFGVGLGVTRGEYESNAFISSDARWAVAGQIRAGVKIDLSTTSSFSVGYQFMLAQYSDNIDNHTIGIGLQFSF
ncbi:MAG: outer membrane beta-barrel protein [Phycisphaerales bacterium]|jgi:opacity protein-like surface antigen|nr:outer membrane beta-barrel protein [Phycisphaerales bacterium]